MENSAHIAYLRTYAAHSDHPHAPEVCRQARAEIARIEPPQIDLFVNPASVVPPPFTLEAS